MSSPALDAKPRSIAQVIMELRRCRLGLMQMQIAAEAADNAALSAYCETEIDALGRRIETLKDALR